ncbi:hypothetical protein FJT64_024045 [Amphibalanus amphitrite]|uniref:RNA-directed DNA polymerase n=1 Tax=Amphibalanus amphitrite TaxID=1232801 RepID=A0A6A4W8H2_AMPAM|nr:hypothetical protein FJT64_024045 [Amphibalanus amphitrite]
MRLVNSRLARTVEELADYDFEICYVPGSLNSAADFFSRTLLQDAEVESPPHGPDLPSGLSHWYKPEGGGDTMVECLQYWIRAHRHRDISNASLRQELLDEAVRTPSKYDIKLDKHSRQDLRLMRLPGQLMAIDMLSVFASRYNVRIIVHFGSQNPLVFRRRGKEDAQDDPDTVHLQCLAGVHFNLLQETPEFAGDGTVLLAQVEEDYRDEVTSEPPPPEDIEKDVLNGKEALPQCQNHRVTQCTVVVRCNTVRVCALLDTGAAVGLISAAALQRIIAEDPALEVRRTSVSIQGLCGNTSCAEYVDVDVAISPGREVRVPLLVDRDESFGHCILLGANFLKAAGVVIDFGKRQVNCGEHVQPMSIASDCQKCQDVRCAAVSSVPTLDTVQEHQQRQQILRSLIHHVQKGTEHKNLPSTLTRYRKFIKKMKITHGVLMYEHPKHGPVSVVNKDWLIDLAVVSHLQMAHIGRDKLCDLLSKQVFCPGMTKVVADIVYCCKSCQLYKTTAQTKAPPTHKIECVEPFELAPRPGHSEIQNSWKPGHPEFAPFRVGELVKKEAHHPGNMLVNKVQRRYDGPFVVTRVNNNGVTYIVKSEDGQEKRVHHSQLRPWKKPPAYLLRSGRCMQDLISVAPDPSLQETSAVDSAERSQDASRMSPPPPLESPRPGAGAVAEASPVASAAPPPPSSSAGPHSSRLMTDAATGTH